MTDTEKLERAPTQHVFEVSNGSIAFGGNQALSSISFGMEKGQLLGLIGPNGSGKTTLLNATSGIYPLNEGTIHFEGTPIQKSAPHEIARAGIALEADHGRSLGDAAEGLAWLG